MKILSFLAMAMLLWCSCGKTEKVEGVKGPRGDKGQRGEDGNSGEPTIIYTPHATPVPVPQPYPYPYPSPVVTVTAYPQPPQTPIPPVIIINRPWPDCESGRDSRCRSGDTVVCACIDTYWQTIGVNVHYRDKLRIKHEGPCFSTALQPNDFWSDCWGKPQTQPPLPNNNRC